MSVQKPRPDHDTTKCPACRKFAKEPRSVIPTWPRFRYAARHFLDNGNVFWELCSDLTDAELAKRHKYVFSVQNRSASHLSPADQLKLFAYIHRPVYLQSEKDEKEGRGLLATCPFGDKVGIIDIDVAKDAGPDAAAVARATATTIDKAMREAGLGSPQWSTTNARGGLHGDIIGPPDFWSPHLPQAYKLWIEGFCKEKGLHNFKSGMGKNKPSDVYVDTSGLNRRTSGRGSGWRIVGGRKPGGMPKTPIALIPDQSELTPVDIEKVKALCDYADLQDVNQSSRRKRDPKAGAPAPLNIQSHLSLVRTYKLLMSHAPKAGGRHDMRLAVAGWLLQRAIPEDVTIATILSAIPSRDGEAEVASAVRTTYSRLKRGLVISSLGTLVKNGVLTNQEARELNEALDEDVIDLGLEPDPPGYWTNEFRQVFLEAATLAKHNKAIGARGKQIRSAFASLRQTGFCSRMFMRAKECGDCKGAISQSPMHCDRAGCMYCSDRKSEAWMQWVKAFWKGVFAEGPIYYAKIPVTFHAAGKKKPRADTTYNRAVIIRDRLFKRLDKSCARRAWVAPGYVLVVMDAKAYQRRGMSIDGEHGQVTSLALLAGLISQVKTDVFEHIASYVRNKDAFGLSQDDWVTARKIVSANKSGNVRFPWFDDLTLRAFKAALRKSQEEVQEFVKNLLAAHGAANRKIAVKNWKQEQANECSEYCQKCGPFAHSVWVVYHRQSRRVIFRGMPGDPLPSFNKVCRLWAQMETAPVQVVDPPTVSYARRN